MSDLISDGFDVKVNHTDDRKRTTYLGISLEYLNNSLIPNGFVVVSIKPARCPRSVVLADCLAHPHSVTNG
jgi:hypothetical protein